MIRPYKKPGDQKTLRLFSAYLNTQTFLLNLLFSKINYAV